MFHAPRFKFYILVATFYFLFSNLAHAVSVRIYFDAPPIVRAGDEFDAKVLIDSDVSLNAYTLALTFPTSSLKVVYFDDSHSLINIWQARPTLFEGGLVGFAGGSTAPFNGEKREIISIHFKVLKEGQAILEFQNPTVYLADGKGTPLLPKASDFSISLVVTSAAISGGGASGAALKDKNPPEIQSLDIISDPFNPGQKLLSFSAVDAGSGINTYLVRSRKWFSWSDWLVVQNPVLLPDGVWAVDFKVLDNAGNASEKIAYEWTVLEYKIIEVLMVLVMVLAAALYTNWRIKRKIKVL